jgi:predicted nucleotidyltransferase
MREILEELQKIEEQHQVRIFYACESGSRAWGFPSSDSDHDVRFLYIRESDWYLSIGTEDKRDVLINKFRSLAPLYYSPTSCSYHYLQMAKNNFREYLKGDVVKIKKYFYVLRPILAIKWIEQRAEIVPMEFGKMVDELI